MHLQCIAFVLIFTFVFPVSDSFDLHSFPFFVHFTIFIKVLDLYSFFYNFDNFTLHCITVYLGVWRIRDVYPGSDFFPSRIPDPNCLHPGSRILIKEFKYFNPKKAIKMVSKL